MTKPVVIIGADHGGFFLKEQAKEWLELWGFVVEDKGAYSHDETDDYPEIALTVAEGVSANDNAQGILFCRSGGGMVIAANKVKGIRAVNLESVVAAEHAKTDNSANVGSLAADWLSDDQAKVIIKTFLESSFSEADRHVRRLAKIIDYEQKHQA